MTTGDERAPNLGDFLAANSPEALALEARLARKAERDESLDVAALLKTLTAREEAIRRIRDSVATAVPRLDVPPPERAARQRDGRIPITWMVVCSDWHIGQKTTLGASGGLFEQSTEIATAQVRELRERLLHLWEIGKGSHHVEKIVWLFLGDLHEGDSMRVSQATRVDRLVTQQNVAVFDLAADLLRHGALIAPAQEVHVVGGNHDRTSPKPGYAGLGELGAIDTYSWVLGEYLARALQQDDGRLTVRNHESFFGRAKVYDYRVIFEHGASIKLGTGSYGGTPWYPVANAARRYHESEGGIDAFVMGHLHQAAYLPLNGGRGWQILNGALPPATEYTQSAFKVIGRPEQSLVVWHAKHGVIDFVPIYLEHPEQPSADDAWRHAA